MFYIYPPFKGGDLMTLSSIFVTIFVITLIILFANLILGGIFDSTIGIDNDILNMTTMLCFLGVTSVLGYLLLNFTTLSNAMVIAIAALIATGLTIVLNIFVFIPLSKMESSTAFKIEEMQGEVGEVTLRIPVDDVGEVTIMTPLGIVTRTAKSYENKELEQGEQALVIEVKDQIFYVVKYDENFNYLDIKKSGGK